MAVIAGLIIGIFMLGLSLLAPKSFQSVRGAALDVTAPISGALNEVTSTAGGLVSGAGNYWDAAHQNAKLKVERKAMLQRMIEAKAILQENGQLKAALQLRERSRDAVAAGRIVGSSLSSPRRFAVLSVGTGDGVQVGMPVRSPDGLIGRVIDAGKLASRVLLISDRANIVPARMLRGGAPIMRSLARPSAAAHHAGHGSDRSRRQPISTRKPKSGYQPLVDTIGNAESNDAAITEAAGM